MAWWVRGKCVGKGAFGVVNVAVSKRDGRVFAVKSVDQPAGQVEALENEIRILRRLASPHVVAYLGDDVTCEGGATAPLRNLHLEYMPGGTVAELDHADVADERLVRRYAWCLVSALRDVHAQGFVHCDVKARNVLLSCDAQIAKLADFGAALESQTSQEKLLPRGSPMWMAPEVVRRERQGPEADMWSLGCTVIEIFTGKPPWEDRGVDTLSRIGYSDELPQFPSALSQLGKDFLDKCLRREPSERWSCDQLLQHPFLLPYTTHAPSPRCVLNWVDSEFAESDNERDQEEVFSKFYSEESSVKNRISKLATSRVNWETQSWVVVREIEPNKESLSSSKSTTTTLTGTKEGTNWKFPNVVIVGTDLEYWDCAGVNREMRKFDWNNSSGSWNSGHGWEQLGRVKGILRNYSLLLRCKKVMSCNILFLMYILCFWIIYVVYLLLHVTEKGMGKVISIESHKEWYEGRVNNPALRSHGLNWLNFTIIVLIGWCEL